MSDLKTQMTDADASAWLSQVEPDTRRMEGRSLDVLFREITGWQPRMWGESIVGYGAYDYTYASGRQGAWMATGFSPRKSQLSIYIMPGYTNFGSILERLGPHKLGKSCLYLRHLDAVDQAVLGELIRAGLDRLADIWPVHST